MIAWIVLGTYLIGWAASIPYLAKLIVTDACGSLDEADAFDFLMGLVFSITTGILWPLLLGIKFLWPYIVKVVYNK